MVGERRLLIVNADDFGQSRGINRGIIEAHRHGIVTSASLMVRWPAVVEAAAYARAHPALSVGLHLDLGEWIFRGDRWKALYEVVPLSDRKKVAGEVSRQFDLFRDIVGRDPTHVDSHQHVHLKRPVRRLVTGLAAELGIPVRNCSPGVRYCPRFYGQTEQGAPYPEGIGVARLTEILAELPPGWTELGCHPGDATDLDTMYRAERGREVTSLCDRGIRDAMYARGVELRSFHDFRSLVPTDTTASAAAR
jgi:predicted glycoside hydrolase/deacetylase ChbG (UPF0249 family)